ncbi:MAG: DUF3800 domain-containing protein [Lachnospiraceae bacterium]|nr:DUF3800 domain-containing protein [Lachnospiraceae bacterium]
MDYDIYCDESRQDLLTSPASITATNRFCCIGGLMLTTESRAALKAKIKELRDKHSVFGEMKWGTVSENKLKIYADLIDLFFDTDELNFRTVVIDAQKVDNDIFNESNSELGYYKFYYQLLFHWTSYRNGYRVFTDQKTNRDKQRLQELKRILNNSFSFGSPIYDIQAIDSKESLILQMENVIMGAVGYKYNFNGNGSSTAKEAIVKHIESQLGHEIAPTSVSEQKFNIFEIQLREGL